jgi:hypothetical protein
VASLKPSQELSVKNLDVRNRKLLLLHFGDGILMMERTSESGQYAERCSKGSTGFSPGAGARFASNYAHELRRHNKAYTDHFLILVEVGNIYFS